MQARRRQRLPSSDLRGYRESGAFDGAAAATTQTDMSMARDLEFAIFGDVPLNTVGGLGVPSSLERGPSSFRKA